MADSETVFNGGKYTTAMLAETEKTLRKFFKPYNSMLVNLTGNDELLFDDYGS